MESNFENRMPHAGPPRTFAVLRIVGLVFAGVMFAVLFALLFGWLVLLLWNWLMPALFGLKAITFWQAFGIVLLAKLLFGGAGPHYGGRHGWRHGKRHWHQHGPFSGKDDEDYRIRGSYRNWGYYDQFWKDEGKAAFEAYVDKMQKKGDQ
jgi:hypothetical protein